MKSPRICHINIGSPTWVSPTRVEIYHQRTLILSTAKIIYSLCFFMLMLSLSAQSSYNMILLGQYDDDNLPVRSGVVYNDVWGYTTPNGQEIAVFGSLDSMFFFDVTDPVHLRRIAVFPGVGRTIWREFKSFKQYIYAIGDDTPEGLFVFDMQYAPDSIKLVHHDDTTFSTSHMLFIDTLTAHLYIAGARNGTQSYDLVMMDLGNNPAQPTLIKRISLPGAYVHDLYVKNDTAYCSHGYNGLYIYDIDSIGNYNTLGSLTIYPQQGYNHSGWLHNNNRWFIFADETHNAGLKIVDVSNKQNIKVEALFRSALLAPVDTMSIAHNPYFKGDLAFISYYHDGIQVFDISNTNQIVKVAYYDTEPNNTNYNGYGGAWGVYPFFRSGNILATDLQNGLFVLRMNIPLAIDEIHLQKLKKKQGLFLSWNISLFEKYKSCFLQGSNDGQNFSDIVQLESAADEKKITNYNFSYYRVACFGNLPMRYSKIVKIHNAVDYSLSVMQNQLVCHGDCPSAFTSIKLIASDGKCLYQKESPVLPILLPELSGGLYFLISRSEEYGESIQKLITY